MASENDWKLGPQKELSQPLENHQPTQQQTSFHPTKQINLL
jgi:hypothetical protein